jgi:hypothetical protein
MIFKERRVLIPKKIIDKKSAEYVNTFSDNEEKISRVWIDSKNAFKDDGVEVGTMREIMNERESTPSKSRKDKKINAVKLRANLRFWGRLNIPRTKSWDLIIFTNRSYCS